MASRAKQDQDPSTTTSQDTSAPEPVAQEQRSSPAYETILVERRERVGLITLSRPKSLNALNVRLSQEVVRALRDFDADDNVGAIVIAGSPRAFAAGADIAEMAEKSFTDFYMDDFLASWDQVRL